jgi:hypothetical protein
MAKNMVGRSTVLTAVRSNGCLTHLLHRNAITTHTRVDVDGSAPLHLPLSRGTVTCFNHLLGYANLVEVDMARDHR